MKIHSLTHSPQHYHKLLASWDTFQPYLSQLKLDYDGEKNKVGILSRYNHLASKNTVASYMVILAISFPFQVRF